MQISQLKTFPLILLSFIAQLHFVDTNFLQFLLIVHQWWCSQRYRVALLCAARSLDNLRHFASKILSLGLGCGFGINAYSVFSATSTRE